MKTRSKTLRKFELKLTINTWYKWTLALLIVLATLLLANNGILSSNIKLINHEQHMDNTYFQEREIHLSRFYNSVNKDDLIRELYKVTGDGKYLIALRENGVFMQQEFDSLHMYCLEDEEYCTRLDSVKYCLGLYIEVLIPQYELAHQAIQKQDGNPLNLSRLSLNNGSVEAKDIVLDPANQEEVWDLLSHNYLVLMDRIVKPAWAIVSMDRDNTKTRRSKTSERISSLHAWQRVVSFMSLAFVALLVFVLIYILIRPLDKPKPVLSRLPDQDYLATYEGFDTEMTGLLEKNFSLFKKYNGLFLVFPRGGLFPGEISHVFQKFCEIHQLSYRQSEELHPEDVEKGLAFMIMEDDTLAAFVEIAAEKGLVIGKETGVLSYDDSPLKRIVADGITVIENIQEDCNTQGSRITKTAPQQCLRFIERESL